MKNLSFQRSQRGVFLIEALIAIVIFAIGILAMISMQAVSIAAQNDSQYRAEAENLIDQLTSQMRITVAHDPVSGNIVPTGANGFAAFAHRAGAAACDSSDVGTPSTNSVVTDWIKTVRGLDLTTSDPIPGKGLPGVVDPQNAAAVPRVQIIANNTMAGVNQVRVTLCWLAPADATAGKPPHRHSVVAYID